MGLFPILITLYLAYLLIRGELIPFLKLASTASSTPILAPVSSTQSASTISGMASGTNTATQPVNSTAPLSSTQSANLFGSIASGANTATNSGA